MVFFVSVLVFSPSTPSPQHPVAGQTN